MKDAGGHGSDPRGAHSEGVQQVGASEPKIWNDVYDYHGGETYGSVYADKGVQRIGHLDYGEFGGKVHIKMVETHPDFRRQGVASAMLDKLKSEYPGSRIKWGGTTQEGEAFKRGYYAGHK